MSNELHLDEQKYAGVIFITFTRPQYRESRHIEDFGNELVQIVTDHHDSRIILSFAGVDFMSSAALDKLVLFDKRCGRHNCQWKMCEVPPAFGEVLQQTRLNTVFQVVDHLNDALQAFGIPVPTP